MSSFLNIGKFHNFPADQNYRVLLPSTNALDVASPDKLSSIWHLSQDHRKLYFTNSDVECLSRPRVPAGPRVPASHGPESRVPRPTSPSPKSPSPASPSLSPTSPSHF